MNLSQYRITAQAITFIFAHHGIMLDSTQAVRESLLINDCISSKSPVFTATKYVYAYRTERDIPLSKGKLARIGEDLAKHQSKRIAVAA